MFVLATPARNLASACHHELITSKIQSLAYLTGVEKWGTCQVPATGLSSNVLGDVEEMLGRGGGDTQFGWDGTREVFVQPLECPLDMWSKIPEEKGMNSGFSAHYYSVCPRASTRTISPVKIRHPFPLKTGI